VAVIKKRSKVSWSKTKLCAHFSIFQLVLNIKTTARRFSLFDVCFSMDAEETFNVVLILLGSVIGCILVAYFCGPTICHCLENCCDNNHNNDPPRPAQSIPIGLNQQTTETSIPITVHNSILSTRFDNPPPTPHLAITTVARAFSDWPR